ncbi:hypothetical protein K440DRAFT_376761 [Wilcoxina mikolae CBS 423.85]|nr:hypothetical protein K440DRAFT_376761 [Wilcoxina mikolae CBS 423.85]
MSVTPQIKINHRRSTTAISSSFPCQKKSDSWWMVSGHADDDHAADPRYRQPYDDESSGSYNDNDNDNDNDDDDDDDEETPDRESPRSEDSGSLTPVATATNTTSFWKPPPPPITLRIPQGPDTYPTPPGDHTSFSPSQQSIGSPYQQTMNAGDFTPSRSNYNLDVNFGQSTPTAIRSPVAQYNTDDLYSPSHSRMPDLSTPIPQILVTQNDPASPMMPVGYHNHYPLEQQMGPPSPRRPQQQEQSSNTYLGASGQGFGARHGGGVQQGEVDVVTFGYGTFPPAKIRMRI